MFNNIYKQKIKRLKIALKNRRARIKELEDKVSMLEFFYDGNGFTKRGLHTAIQIGDYIGTLEKRIEELEMTVGTLRTFSNEQATCIERLQKENAELQKKISFLEDNLRVARKDREDLQLDIARGLKEFVKDSPATALRYLANEKYVEQLNKAKEIIKDYCELRNGIFTNEDDFNMAQESLDKKAEQFIKVVEA